MNESSSIKKSRKIRSLSKEHRQKISQAHKGKTKIYFFSNRKKIIISPAWLKKRVICINNGQIYESIAKAAEKVYQNKSRYINISKVCKGIKPHYKKYIWRFEEDFLALPETEKQDLRNKCTELHKTFTRYKTRLLYKGVIYDSFANLGLVLNDNALLSYKNNTRDELSKLLSTMIGVAKKKHCPFVILKNEYIFWADYEVLCKDPRGAFKINEKPIDKTVEEIQACYIKHLDKVIGDMTISELLQSTKKTFYKLDNLYFKSMCNMKKLSYNNIINKKTLLYLIDNSRYKFLFNLETYDFANSTKNKFYIKNNYIFLTPQDYITRFIKCLTKEEIINELNILD